MLKDKCLKRSTSLNFQALNKRLPRTRARMSKVIDQGSIGATNEKVKFKYCVFVGDKRF